MGTRIEIDLNVRIRGRQTFAGFENIHGGHLPEVHDYVTVFEPETGLEGNGRVTEVDLDRQVIYLAVDWASMTEPSEDAVATVSGLARYVTAARLVQAVSATTAEPREGLLAATAHTWSIGAGTVPSLA
jgi:hypothetical protein